MIKWTSIRLAQLARAKRQQLPKVNIVVVLGENEVSQPQPFENPCDERETGSPQQ